MAKTKKDLARWANDEAVAMLKKLHAEGRSAAQISREINHNFGTDFSRSAIIGKIHRMGLHRGYTSQSRPYRNIERKDAVGAGDHYTRRNANAKRNLTPEQKLRRKLRIEHAALASAPDEWIDQIHEYDSGRRTAGLLTIHDLTDETCRWPIGDPKDAGFGYCGAKALPGNLPYCDHHTMRSMPSTMDKEKARERGAMNLPGVKLQRKRQLEHEAKQARRAKEGV